MESKRRDLNNEIDISNIQRRIRDSFQRITKTSEGAHDCAQEIFARMLEGRHQHATIDQAVIDYLRANRNLKGLRSRVNFKTESHTDSYEQGEFDRFIGNDLRGDVDAGIDFNRIIGMSRHWERAIMTLFFREEYGQAEIGNLFGVSESRVSQWLQRIQKRIQARINQTESNLRGQAQKRMESLLPEETERERRRLEQSTFERMEIGQSWSMESFDEACF